MVFSENLPNEQRGEESQDKSWPEIKYAPTEEGERHKEIVEDFEKRFKKELVDRGVYNDFSLRRVVEMVGDGDLDFDDKQREVYNKIKDLLEEPKKPNEGALPVFEIKKDNNNDHEQLAA